MHSCLNIGLAQPETRVIVKIAGTHDVLRKSGKAALCMQPLYMKITWTGTTDIYGVGFIRQFSPDKRQKSAPCELSSSTQIKVGPTQAKLQCKSHLSVCLFVSGLTSHYFLIRCTYIIAWPQALHWFMILVGIWITFR